MDISTLKKSMLRYLETYIQWRSEISEKNEIFRCTFAETSKFAEGISCFKVTIILNLSCNRKIISICTKILTTHVPYMHTWHVT